MVVRKRKSRKKKKSSGAAGVLLAILLVAILLAGAAAWLILAPFGPSHETFVELPPGSSTVQMGRSLEEAGVVRSRFAFDLLRWGKRGTLRAGEYRFDHPVPVTEIYARIARGTFIPEQLSSLRAPASLISPPAWNKPGLVPVWTFWMRQGSKWAW